MESNIDRKERTVYVTGMHRSVTEDMIYDLFEKVGLVEKVVMHENDEGDPHHALVVFKHAESVMYSISVYNGYRLFDQSLNMRPLRESSHAAVFQRAGPSRNMSMRLAQLSLGPPTPPTSPAESKHKSSPRRIVKKSLLAGEMKDEEDRKTPGGGRRNSRAGSSGSLGGGSKHMRGGPSSGSPPPIEREFYASFPPQAYTQRYSPQPHSYGPESGYLDRSFGSLGSSPGWTPRFGFDAQPFGPMWGGAGGYGPVLSPMDTSFGRSPNGAGGSHPHLGMPHHHNNHFQRYRSQPSTTSLTSPPPPYCSRPNNGYPPMPHTPNTPSWNESLHDEQK